MTCWLNTLGSFLWVGVSIFPRRPSSSRARKRITWVPPFLMSPVRMARTRFSRSVMMGSNRRMRSLARARVGIMYKTPWARPDVMTRSRAGASTASLLPDPVAAWTMRSRPSRIGLMALIWTGRRPAKAP